MLNRPLLTCHIYTWAKISFTHVVKAMDLERLQEVLDCFFDRAVISISYSASSRMLERLTSSSAHGPNLSLTVLGLTIVCLLLLSEERVRRNACLQTTCSILVSKLVIKACTPMEPAARHDAWVLPGIICFFLALYSTLCGVVRHVLCTGSLRAQWDQIVPFVVVFSTSAILRAIKQEGELRFLYVAVICHLLWWSSFDPLSAYFPYLAQFVDSIMARGILLILDDFVFGATLRPGIGLCLLFACWLTILCVLFPRGKRSRQLEICVGVLSYSLCGRVVNALKLLCHEQMGVTFAVVISSLILLLYLPQPKQPSLFEYTPLCSNALSILWGSMLDSWVFSFYQEWEQILMYIVLFWSIQGLKDAITPVLQKSQQQQQLQQQLLLRARQNNTNEAMLIAHETQHELQQQLPQPQPHT